MRTWKWLEKEELSEDNREVVEMLFLETIFSNIKKELQDYLDGWPDVAANLKIIDKFLENKITIHGMSKDELTIEVDFREMSKIGESFLNNVVALNSVVESFFIDKKLSPVFVHKAGVKSFLSEFSVPTYDDLLAGRTRDNIISSANKVDELKKDLEDRALYLQTFVYETSKKDMISFIQSAPSRDHPNWEFLGLILEKMKGY